MSGALLRIAVMSLLPAAAFAEPAHDPSLDPAAVSAWRFVEANYQPGTGLVSALGGYHFGTMWDLASSLAALYCGHELGMLPDAAYDKRMRRALRTLLTVRLFDGAAFNHAYSTRTGAMAGTQGRQSRRGSGWSPTDIGRLLVWLRIIATTHPQYAEDAAAIVRRLDATKLVRDGYLRGFSLGTLGKEQEYQEGRLGYEQYAASGFVGWGFPADKAARLEENAVPIQVMGQSLLADVRGGDRLTSEPLVLMGLELGWQPELRALAEALLLAQEERYRRTGRVTVVSEDAIGQPPHYFYYYCAYTNAREFAVDVQDHRAAVSGPRWVSTKAAFGWHALLPREYTRRALAALQAAQTPRGWGSGVDESSGASMRTININTQAVILEAALYARRGRPLLERP